MKSWLEKTFHLKENQTDVRTEFLGGLTTFMTMSYIIFVQPAIMGGIGMDAGAVMVATCLASAVATLLTGLLTNYPIAQAPAMGHNVFFAVTVCGLMGYTWQVALGANFISGCLFTLLALLGVAGQLVDIVPESLKQGIAAGIGLLIALIGLEYAGIVVATPGVLIGLGHLGSRPVLVALFGLVVAAVLMARRIPGALLWGILSSALLGLALGVVKFHGLFSAPPSLSPTFLKLDISVALKGGLIPIIFVFFFLDVFDTVGTLVGVCGPAGFFKGKKLPRANEAMLADAVGTVTATLLGTSTVSSYVESSTGIAQGARTGLANVFTSIFFLATLFLSPLAEMIGGSYVADGQVLHPVIAPALIIVGFMMTKTLSRIDWEDITEAIPAFLTLVVTPLTVSITDGLAFGFISYSLLKIFKGEGKKVHWLVYLISLLLLARYFLD
ncbi:MAG TPA: NCS2 family permease [Candidatus Saccharicenans sp.]|nr:NCS2 family permease [Candidatus Saccharicenans sp.]HQO75513.1 NCS2 family permease [Candidatus Saccharicenans sp.]HUM78527.1 NCS2 family permease [Candidatus Saccharicenans sp.]